MPADMHHISSFCRAAACHLCPYCQHTGVFNPTALPLSRYAEHINSGSYTGVVSINELCFYFFIFFVLRLDVEGQILGLDTVECVLFLNVCLLQKLFIWHEWLTPAGQVMSDHMTWLCVGLECEVGFYSF